MTREDVYETAVHEAGHTTTIWLLEHVEPLVKISIVPRGQALGVNMLLPEDRVGMKKEAFLDKICTFMGGRAAEELFLGTITSIIPAEPEEIQKMFVKLFESRSNDECKALIEFK